MGVGWGECSNSKPLELKMQFKQHRWDREQAIFNRQVFSFYQCFEQAKSFQPQIRSMHQST
jgi:hypothetical protein